MVSKRSVKDGTLAIKVFEIVFLGPEILSLSVIHTTKPNFLYKKDDTFREFGLGYLKKTVLPIWLIVIVIAILCYLSVLYYLSYPSMVY